MIKKLYEEAGRLEGLAHAEREKDKSGILRGGTTGALNSDGEPVGHCHRKALIRYLGHQKEAGSNSWFDMGIANEHLWLTKLQKSWDGQLRCEEEIPIVWDLDGTPITGRPDIVLLDAEGGQVAGIELKAVGAVNSASKVYFTDSPKVENLFQAAHYSSQLAVPFYLIYTYHAKGPLPYYSQKEYGVKELGPFIKEFKVEIRDDGQIIYTRESGQVVVTPYTFEGIKEFYRLVIAMAAEKNLYKRFEGRDVSGNKLPYDSCKYCEYQSNCDRFENSYDDWIDSVVAMKIVG